VRKRTLHRFQLTPLVDLLARDIETAVKTLERRLKSVGINLAGFVDGADLDTNVDYSESELLQMLGCEEPPTVLAPDPHPNTCHGCRHLTPGAIELDGGGDNYRCVRDCAPGFVAHAWYQGEEPTPLRPDCKELRDE